MDSPSSQTLLKQMLNEQDPERLRELARTLYPADLALLVEEMDETEQRRLFQSLDNVLAGELLDELDPDIQQALLQATSLERASDILEEMPPDEAVDLLGELSEQRVSALLQEMTAAEAEDLRGLLGYETDTAGGQMTTEFIAVEENLTVEQTIQQLREVAPDAETIYYLFVVDVKDKLVGVVSLRSLIVSRPEQPIAEIMNRDVISVSADADQEDAVELIARYNLFAVPVIDEEGRPIGMITVDDAVDVLDEEAEEDIYGVGVSPEEAWNESPAVLSLLGSRLPRLGAVLAAALIMGAYFRWLLGSAAQKNELALLVAAIFPAMLALSWAFQSYARALLLTRLSASRDPSDLPWPGLLQESLTSSVMAAGCGGICGWVLHLAYPHDSAVTAVSLGLAVGLVVSTAGAYLLPRLLLEGRHGRTSLPAGSSVITHLAGVLVYLGVAFGIGRP